MNAEMLTSETRIRSAVLDEYAYWRDVDMNDHAGACVALGAMGAASNILAVFQGIKVDHRAMGQPRLSHAVMPSEVTAFGRPWFGVIRIRVLLGAGDWRTFWHLALPFNWTIGVAFPARMVRLFGGK